MGSCCGKKKAVSPAYKQEVYRTKSPIIERDDEQDYSAMLRISNIALTTNNPQQLLTGYQDEPRASLEEALQPVDGKMDNLFQHIKEAKTKCHYPSDHGLTRDESAAIYIYTMKWDNRCVHNQLQGALNSGDRSQVKPWFMYLKLLKSAFDKLPTASTGIWQGTSFDDRLNDKFSSQSASLYTSLGSCSPSDEGIKEYLQKHSGPKRMLIRYESVNGKLVTGYTASESQEIMIWPGWKVGVSKYARVDDHGSIVVHLTSKNDHPKPKKNTNQPTEKHFVCQTNCCGNHCRGNHKPEHCYGFAHIFHTHYSHHCGPVDECFKCGRDDCDLLECNKCQSRYCIKCSIK